MHSEICVALPDAGSGELNSSTLSYDIRTEIVRNDLIRLLYACESVKKDPFLRVPSNFSCFRRLSGLASQSTAQYYMILHKLLDLQI